MTRDIHSFPRIEQCANTGVGEIINFVEESTMAADPRLAAFRDAADDVMDLVYAIHATDERAVGASCASCQYERARAAGWEPGDGKTWVHKATKATAATLADALACVDRGVPS